MEALTVFTTNQEQSRALKAFLKALNISYMPASKNTLSDLEAQLTPEQLTWWTNLKTAIKEVENGTAEGMDWEDFKKELAYEDSIAQTV